MMWESLREAVDEEMERDPTVCVMGARPRPARHLHHPVRRR
jgi:pyruvate/2-oxoglutarate/acetoin dehydrogenase E1 component